MFLIDMEQGRIIEDKELKDNLANGKPYKSWIDAVRIKLDEIEPKAEEVETQRREAAALLDRQQAFGYTQEDVKFLMAPMAQSGEEAVGSMGNDSPLAVMSSKNKTLYHYFKQLFAQVTNPPIDPIRENMVMSLVSFIGPKPNLLDTTNINPTMRLEVSQPVLDFKRHREDPRHRQVHRRQIQLVRAEHLLPGRVGQGRRGSAPRLAVRGSRRCGEVRLQHADRVGPQDGPRQRRDPGAARHLRHSTRTSCSTACARARVWSWKPARRVKRTTSRCSRATARKPCTRTSRWKRSRRWPKA